MSGVHARKRGGFIENTIEGLHAAMERVLYSENSSTNGGLLQRLDPRVKVAGLFGLIVAATLSGRLWVIAAILAVAVVMAGLSRLSPVVLASRIWTSAFVFTGPIAIPALFLTPGAAAWRVPALDWAITVQGIRTAAFMLLRVETAATLALLLIFTTPWMHVLKALRIFRAPVVFVVILGMTCRYILLMLDTAHGMFESRKSRTVGRATAADHRRMAISSAGVLLSRTFQLSEDVFLAMQSRGFRGEVYLLDEFAMKGLDWAALATFACLGAMSIWAGR